MSDNKLSETLAKIFIGKSIVSGLKPEPDYEFIECFKCGHNQRVPLTRIETVQCHKCGNNLDTQVKPLAPPEIISGNLHIAVGTLFILTFSVMMVAQYQEAGSLNNLFGYFLIFSSAFFGLGWVITLFQIQTRKKTAKKMKPGGIYLDPGEEITIKSVLYLMGKYILFFLSGMVAIVIVVFVSVGVFPYSLIWLVPMVVYFIYWAYFK